MSISNSPDQEHSPVLGLNVFQDLQSQILFEAIDDLQKTGVENDLDLPELILVGSQSVGKSSLLQSITHIPFPVAENDFTRFPIRIVYRQTLDKAAATKVSIEPGVYCDFGYSFDVHRSARLSNFGYEFTTMTVADFAEVISKAAEAMSVSVSNSVDTGSGAIAPKISRQNFSSDVLKIEISGLDRSNYSIIDIPGVFQSPIDGLSDKEEKGVKEMVESYMKSKQNIIICVASGASGLTNREVLSLAAKYDPKYERTVGVITKCDITLDAEWVCAYAEEVASRLDHKWFCVRNSTRAEAAANISHQERIQKERQLFAKDPWKRLSTQVRCGIPALEVHIAGLICQRIQAILPATLRAIQNQRNLVRQQFDRTEDPRGSLDRTRLYLTKTASDIHSIASQNLRGRYDTVSSRNVNLRRIIREMNDAFSLAMNTNGHQVPFLEIPFLEISKVKDRSAQNGPPITSSLSFSPPVIRNESRISPLFDSYESISSMEIYQAYSFEELRLSDYQAGLSPDLPRVSNDFGFGFSLPSSSNASSAKQVYSARLSSENGLSAAGSLRSFRNATDPPDLISRWIQDEIKASRGTELQGTLNPDIFPILFHRQASKWASMSQHHFSRVAACTLTVIKEIIQMNCGDEKVRQRLYDLVDGASRQTQSDGLVQLEKHLKVIFSRHLQTNNHTFEANVQEARRLRFQAALKRYHHKDMAKTLDAEATQPISILVPNGRSIVTPPFVSQSSSTQGNLQTTPEVLVIDMRDTEALFNELHMSNQKNLELEIHDILKAYYEVARDNFVEYVTQHVVEPYLSDEKGAILLFSPAYVAGMPDAEVEAMATTDEQLEAKRAELQRKAERLDRAWEVASKYSKVGYFNWVMGKWNSGY